MLINVKWIDVQSQLNQTLAEINFYTKWSTNKILYIQKKKKEWYNNNEIKIYTAGKYNFKTLV